MDAKYVNNVEAGIMICFGSNLMMALNNKDKY